MYNELSKIAEFRNMTTSYTSGLLEKSDPLSSTAYPIAFKTIMNHQYSFPYFKDPYVSQIKYLNALYLK